METNLTFFTPMVNFIIGLILAFVVCALTDRKQPLLRYLMTILALGTAILGLLAMPIPAHRMQAIIIVLIIVARFRSAVRSHC